MIARTSSINLVNVPNIIKVRSAAGKLSVPLKPIFSMYAQFKHITGVPQKGEGSGVSVSKLMILDNLIDQLVAVKGKNNVQHAVEMVKMSPDKVDDYIENFYSDLHKHITGASPYAGILVNERGLLLDLVA